MKKIIIICLSVFTVFRYPLVCSADEPPPDISAKAAVVMDSHTGKVIYEKNSDEKLPVASTTKIMTTLLCLESGNLDEEFTVDSEAIKTEGSSMGLVEGDIVSKRDLCVGMLLPSGNDAANAAAVLLGGSYENFSKMMNNRAADIGMTHTYFITPSGLHAEGHGSSAYDMALLTREALKNEDFKSICSQPVIKLKFGNPPYDRWLKNSNKLLSLYEGVTGVKTGFTDEAGRCLVSACNKNNTELICVTLNDPDDWQDHIQLYDYAFDISESVPADIQKFEVSVVGSDKDSIILESEEDIKSIKINGNTAEITAEVFTEPFLYAPVHSGDCVGYAEYYCGDISIGRYNVYAAEDAEIVKNNNKNIFEKIRCIIREKLGL